MAIQRLTLLVPQSIIPTPKDSSSANQPNIFFWWGQIVSLITESRIPFTNTSNHVWLWIKHTSADSPTGCTSSSSSNNYPLYHWHSPGFTEHWIKNWCPHHSSPKSHNQSSCSHTDRRTQTPWLKENSMTPNRLWQRHKEGRCMAQGAIPLLSQRELHRGQENHNCPILFARRKHHSMER